METPSKDQYLGTRTAVMGNLERIDPISYEKTRNYLHGSVTWMSPYVTHGIISTSEIAETVLETHDSRSCYQLMYELGWREYFHQIWQANENRIFSDLKHAQTDIHDRGIPQAILSADTTIHVLDTALQNLFENGLIHNHARMWIAGVVCNTAHRAWYQPARWMHYHLLDGDLASNTLSWQWIAGSFSNKKYIANQQNLNKYSGTEQQGTFLDCSYETLSMLATPEVLRQSAEAVFIEQVGFGNTTTSRVNKEIKGKAALRSIWNLDPDWKPDIKNHLVFVDVDWLKQWPMSSNRWLFIMHWATQCNASVLVASLDQLKAASEEISWVRKDYPACNAWPGDVEPRNWLYDSTEENFTRLPSFSRFWKKARKRLPI